MRLELALTHLQNVCFGPRTAIDGGVLSIHRDALVRTLEEDPLFDRVEIEIAHPGESCRILNILDVYEPRNRTAGVNFPGALEEFGLVGDGRTCVLKNISVIVNTQRPERARSVIDMRGPAAELSPFGKLHNIVVIPHPAHGADLDEYRLAAKKAGLKTAAYLAAAAKELAPDETQVYELGPTATSHELDLPRIAYIFPIHSHQHPTHQKESVFYGSNIQGFMPTIVHPNEILDGCLVFSYSALTYFAQNHPVIYELYRRHGRDLWFAGVVATVAPMTMAEKERNTALAVRLAKETLAADGIIATKIGGGAVDTDLMMIYARAETMGMKAALVIMERYPDTGITFVPPGVDALVSPGLTRDPITLPTVERLIGGSTIQLDSENQDNTKPDVPSVPANNKLKLWVGDIAGAISQVGASRLTTYLG